VTKCWDKDNRGVSTIHGPETLVLLMRMNRQPMGSELIFQFGYCAGTHAGGVASIWNEIANVSTAMEYRNCRFEGPENYENQQDT
jgi:hypothetical protein